MCGGRTCNFTEYSDFKEKNPMAEMPGNIMHVKQHANNLSGGRKLWQ